MSTMSAVNHQGYPGFPRIGFGRIDAIWEMVKFQELTPIARKKSREIHGTDDILKFDCLPHDVPKQRF